MIILLKILKIIKIQTNLIYKQLFFSQHKSKTYFIKKSRKKNVNFELTWKEIS